MLNKSADNMTIPGYNAEELSKFKNNIAWIYHATTKIKAKHRNQRVLSVLRVTAAMELKEEPPVFDGTILFRSSNGSNAIAQIIFLMKPKENDKIDTYRTGWIYEDNIVIFDTSLHQCDRGSNNYIPMNDRTYGFHLRLLSDAKRTLGEDYTLLNLLVTVNCRISKNHNYYPYDLASLVTEPTDNTVAEPEVISDK